MRRSQPLKWVSWGGGELLGRRSWGDADPLVPGVGLIVLMSYSESTCSLSDEAGRW